MLTLQVTDKTFAKLQKLDKKELMQVLECPLGLAGGLDHIEWNEKEIVIVDRCLQTSGGYTNDNTYRYIPGGKTDTTDYGKVSAEGWEL